MDQYANCRTPYDALWLGRLTKPRAFLLGHRHEMAVTKAPERLG